MENNIINEMAHIIADIYQVKGKIVTKERELERLENKLKAKAKQYYSGEYDNGSTSNIINLYDKVTVVSNSEEMERCDGKNYAGESGVVVEIDESWDFPYSVKFDNPELSDEWLWTREELEFKKGEW